MRMLFLGKNKDSVIKALDYVLLKNIDVAAVVGATGGNVSPDTDLLAHARARGLRTMSPTELYEALHTDSRQSLGSERIDIAISFLFSAKIRKPLIDFPRIGCINFHSAPLPQYRGWGVYNMAILNREKTWGVSAHWVDEDFDTGDLTRVYRFDINPDRETAFTLERKSQVFLLDLFMAIVDDLAAGRSLPRLPQDPQEGKTYPKRETLAKAAIAASDSPEEVDRKIRAFWHPPHEGAFISIGGQPFFLVTRDLLGEVRQEHSLGG